MSPLFTSIVIVMGLLAVMGIVVGVANDAVNFLNSALGSKAAPRRVILWIAAAGILVGTLTSSGMMEVARSGVFYPGQFSFPEIMMLFLGMMLGNILLLDIYNTLGLPTSTTVSMVFGLLGAGVAAALYHIWGDPAASVSDLSQYINTGKAMAIIAAILLSVALAFAAGSLFMYVSRLIFSFRYAKAFRRWGAVWCGISLAGILYFALFKGLKSSGLIPTSVGEYVGEHVLVTLLVFWAGASVVLWIFQRMRLNIMRITILTGTFALALAFAGNDLVNFIGVPLASYDAWQIAREAGSESIMMGELANPARANFLLLLLSGAVMVLTLFFSKKSRHVTETELSLASQHEGDERFGSNLRIAQSGTRLARAQHHVDGADSRPHAENHRPTLRTAARRRAFVGALRHDPRRRKPHGRLDPDRHRHLLQTAALDHLRGLHGGYGFIARRPDVGPRKRRIPHHGRHGRHFGVVHHRARRIPDRPLRDAAAALGRLDRRHGARRSLRMVCSSAATAPSRRRKPPRRNCR